MADTIGTRFGDRARKWTAEEDAYLVRRLRKEGATYNQVAIELKRPRCSIAGRIGRLEKGMVNLQEASDARFIALFKAGTSRQDMADALGITVNSVNKRVGRLRKIGMLPLPEPAQPKVKAASKPKAKVESKPRKVSGWTKVAKTFSPHSRAEAMSAGLAAYKPTLLDIARKPHLVGIPLELLTPQSCRYACNDADVRQGEEHLFCGAPKVEGKAYCAAHLAICEVKHVRAAA